MRLTVNARPLLRLDQVRVVLFLDVARKMVWPLALLNRLFLWIAHQDKSVKEIRRNATIKTA